METEKSINMVEDIKLVETIKLSESKRAADKAFEILFNKYKDHLSFLIRSKVTSSEEVQDITMIAFGKAYTNIHQYNEQSGAFSTWLYTIFNNLFIDYLRRRKDGIVSLSEMEHTNEDGEKIPYTLSTEEKTIEQIMADKEVRAIVRKSLCKMKSAFHRELIEMRYYKDMCYEAMAEETEKPLGTVKGELFRAKEELKAILMRNPMFS